MSVREAIRHRRLRAQWRVMDALIVVKEHLLALVATLFEHLPWEVEEESGLRGYVLVAPGVLLVGFIAVGMALLVWYSFLTFDSIEVLVYDYTLKNWIRFVEGAAFHSIFIRTFLYSVLVTVLAVSLAVPYAYLVIRTDTGLLRRVLLFSLFIPFFTGVIIRVYGWLILLGQNGVVNWILRSFGLQPVNFIGTSFAVIIGLVQYMLPFAVLMITPAIASIDPDLERAAQNCGASRWETFRHVVLPLARPGLTAATIVVFTITMATYSIPKLLGAGKLSFAANFIYLKVFSTFNYPFAAVLSIVLVVLASGVVFTMFRVYGTGTLGVEVDDA